ncbi:MAG: SDR family oxidoreductase [Rhizomicrobium sp.]
MVLLMPSRPKVALVTGSGSGIGKESALALLNAGYRVACGYNHNRAGAEAIADTHPAALPVKIDIASRSSVRKAIRTTAGHFRADIAIVVNNAALNQEKPFEKLTDADWDQMLAINLRGAFIVVQEALPPMIAQKWGRIVNISSIGGQWGGMRQVHYAAAKAGLINFTHSLARLYSPAGITANAIAPGLVATAMVRKELRSKAGKAKLRAIPAGRVARPAEIAGAILYLVSDEAAYVTGHTLAINGGLLMS